MDRVGGRGRRVECQRSEDTKGKPVRGDASATNRAGGGSCAVMALITIADFPSSLFDAAGSCSLSAD